MQNLARILAWDGFFAPKKAFGFWCESVKPAQRDETSLILGVPRQVRARPRGFVCVSTVQQTLCVSVQRAGARQGGDGGRRSQSACAQRQRRRDEDTLARPRRQPGARPASLKVGRSRVTGDEGGVGGRGAVGGKGGKGPDLWTGSERATDGVLAEGLQKRPQLAPRCHCSTHAGLGIKSALTPQLGRPAQFVSRRPNDDGGAHGWVSVGGRLSMGSR